MSPRVLGLLLVAWASLSIPVILASCKEEVAEKTTIPGKSITIRWTIVNDPAEMQRLRDQFGARADRVEGFAVWQELGDKIINCHIYTHPIRDIDDFKTVRTVMHEVKHCTEGRWHN